MKQTIRSYKLLLISILALLIVYSCSDTVDVITYDTPELTITGTQVLAVEVNRSDGQSMTGYDISISGPTSASQNNVQQSVFVLDDLASGTYTVLVEREGYISDEFEVEIELPDEATATYYYEAEAYLRLKAPSVVIINDQDNVIQTGPSDDPGLIGQEMSLDILAGTFPESVVNSNGNVSVSVTRARPSVVDNTFDGTTQAIFYFEPDDVELNQEVEVTFPIVVPGDNPDNVSYTLEPGNIPVTLELDEAAKLSGGQLTELNDNQQVTASFRFGRFRINRFRRYRLVPDVTISASSSFTNPRSIATSGCGLDVDVEHTFERGTLGPVIGSFVNIPQKTYTHGVAYDGVIGTRLTVSVQKRTVTYTARNRNGQVLETATIQRPPLIFTVTARSCHDSGGG